MDLFSDEAIPDSSANMGSSGVNNYFGRLIINSQGTNENVSEAVRLFINRALAGDTNSMNYEVMRLNEAKAIEYDEDARR